jgi:predicted nucleotide-binding protein
VRIYLGWSGEQSRRIANLFRDWLPQIFFSVEPVLAADDIEPGDVRWSYARLEGVDLAIFCLTRSNADSPWLNFEVGAAVKALDRGSIIPCALDVAAAELAGPISQFQVIFLDEIGINHLLGVINSRSSNPVSIRVLQVRLAAILPELESVIADIRGIDEELPPFSVDTKPRTQDDLIDEMRGLLRDINFKVGALEERLTSTPPPLAAKPAIEKSTGKPRLFIGSSSEGRKFADFIQLDLSKDVECTVWTQGMFQPSMTNFETLVNGVSNFDFAVIVMTADDIQIKRGVESRMPRDNLLFELGLFTGHLTRSRTFIACPSDERPIEFPSDFDGVTRMTFESKRSDNSTAAAVGPVCTQLRERMGL